MPFFIREVPGHDYQTWEIDVDVAKRLGISAPENVPGCFFTAELGETIWQTLERKTPWFADGKNPFVETKLAPGEFYPRIGRPSNYHPNDFPKIIITQSDDQDFIAIARSQLGALTRQLDLICQTVHPSHETFKTFGHSIRNLLVLSCTEVEMHWRGILSNNNYANKSYTTNDYVLLKDAMRLYEYEIIFPSFPWLDPVSPFSSWSEKEPTKSLAWYSAYNAVKHNRELEFNLATLENLFAAVSACVIMMVAQFGILGALGRNTEVASFFQFKSWPKWPLSDVYIITYATDALVRVPYPFPKTRKSKKKKGLSAST